jgi:hypothetical protein
VSKADRYDASKIPGHPDAATILAHGPSHPARAVAAFCVEWEGREDIDRLERRWFVHQLTEQGIPENEASDRWEQKRIHATLALRSHLLQQTANPAPGFFEAYGEAGVRLKQGRKMGAVDALAFAVVVSYRAIACTDGTEDDELAEAKTRFGEIVHTPTRAEFWEYWVQLVEAHLHQFIDVEKRSIFRVAEDCGLKFAPGKRGRPPKQAGRKLGPRK